MRQALLLVACLAVACGYALHLGQDANWDLLNYHFYNAWGWLHGRTFGPDIAAAQLQTFHNPLLDLPFYGMVSAGWPPRAIACVLAVPTAAAAFLFVGLCARMLRADADASRRAATLAACAIGLTGPMGRSQAASTMNEWPVAALVMLALWLVLRTAPTRQDGVPASTLLGAGIAAGVGTGLKLTAAPYALGLALALLVRSGLLRQGVREAALFSAAAGIGVALGGGFWFATLWQHFGNPLFPYLNEWFRSPWWEPAAILGRHFGPHDLAGFLRLPFDLFAPAGGFVGEERYRDPRFALLYVATLAVLASATWRSLRPQGSATRHDAVDGGASRSVHRVAAGVPRSVRAVDAHASHSIEATDASAWRFVGTFFVASFSAWALIYSVARYLIPLEMLTGPLIVALVLRLARASTRRQRAAVVAVAIGAIALTRIPDWGRVAFGPRWFDVRAPALDPGALVLLASDAPLSYVLPFLGSGATYVGAANNMNHAEHRNRMQEAIRAAIATHAGPLYALAFPPRHPALQMEAYGLRPRACAAIETNMPASPLQLCRLVRD